MLTKKFGNALTLLIIIAMIQACGVREAEERRRPSLYGLFDDEPEENGVQDDGAGLGNGTSDDDGVLPRNDQSAKPAIDQAGGDETATWEIGGGDFNFKIPLPPGDPWEVTQSWKDHCQVCNNKGYDTVYGDYCTSSSTHYGLANCIYGWDFNLGGGADSGKAVLASGDGEVKYAGQKGDWGNTVVINHGSNVCTRYAHMLDGSLTVTEGDEICQGLKIGEVGGTPNFPPHLHFQFEECDTGTPLRRGFTDGNGIPICTVDGDVYDNEGEYDFLTFTNVMIEDCEEGEVDFSGADLPEGGWTAASCGTIPNCPMIPSCGRSAEHRFDDNSGLTVATSEAASYLYSECALDGREDGSLGGNEKVTKAEALKIALYLFGLNNDCGTDVPFEDVEQSDWYFRVIACAVHHRIVELSSEVFTPNAKVDFADAARYLTLAASKAGVIDIQHPATGHFSEIPSSYWAYDYVETLYAYGGIMSSPGSYSPDDDVKRSEYIVMAASLSPCFCRNVDCSGGCRCDQETFSCVNTSIPDNGMGGASGDDDEEEEDWRDDSDDGDADDSSDYEDVLEDKWIDLEIHCHVDLERTVCENGEVVLYIKCTVENPTDEDLKINDLPMAMTDSSDRQKCEVTDETLRSGAGVEGVDSGETRELDGHYKIACDTIPADRSIEVSFDLKEKVSGEILWYYDLLEDEIEVTTEMFTVCDDDTSGTNDNASGEDDDPEGNDDPEDDPDPTCVPHCENKECGSDGCGGSCGQCIGSRPCQSDGKCCAPVSCDVLGKECGGPYSAGCGETVSCGACALGGLCQNAHCCFPTTCLQLGASCGEWNDGCNRLITCGVCPVGSVCESGECRVDPCALCPLQECINGQCMEERSGCDPTTGYKIYVESPGGTLQVMYTGQTAPMSLVLATDQWTRITFACEEMPAALLVQGGATYVRIWTEEGMDSFAMWLGYTGPLTLTAPSNPSTVITNFTATTPNLRILVRMPTTP